MRDIHRIKYREFYGENMSWNIISAKEIEKYMDEDKAVLVDLRDFYDYEKNHIPNSINIPVTQLKRQLNRLKDYNVIILYCEHGNLSLKVARKLGEMVRDRYRIYSIYGGITAYEQYQKMKE